MHYYTGVFSVRVALLAEKADIQFDPDETDANTLVSDIKGLGFGAQFIGESQGSEEGKVDLVVRNTITLVSSSPTSCIYTLHVYHVAWFAVSLPSSASASLKPWIVNC